MPLGEVQSVFGQILDGLQAAEPRPQAHLKEIVDRLRLAVRETQDRLNEIEIASADLSRALSPEPIVAGPAKPAPAVAAWKALQEAAGPRLRSGRVTPITVTGLPSTIQSDWVRAWLALDGAYTVADASALGRGLASRKVWDLPRPISVSELIRRLPDLLADGVAQAEGPARPSGPSDIEPARERCGVGWCDGQLHYSADPDQVRRPQTAPCPRRSPLCP